MATQNRLDLTTGVPLLRLLRFCIPVIIGNLFQTCYNLVDTIVVGRVLGASSLAAIGTTGSTTSFLLNLAFAFTTAYSIILSQNFGAKNENKIRATVATAVYTSAAMSLVVGLLGFFFADSLMGLLRVPEEIRPEATLYVQICVGLGVGQIAYNAVSAILRSIGDSTTPLYFLIASSVLNVVLDLLFVAVFSWGVAGVAIATVISQGVSAAACGIFMVKKFPIFRLSKADFRPDWHTIGLTLRMGAVISLQTVFTMVGEMVVTSVLNGFGTSAIAANTAAARSHHILVTLSASVAHSYSVFAGQNLGAGRLDRVKQGVTQTAWALVGLGVFSSLLMIFFGEQFVRLFVGSQDEHLDEILRLARIYINLSAAFYIPLNLCWLYNGALRGAGDTKVPMLSGWCELVFKCGGSILFSRLWGWYGLSLGNPLSWLAGMVPVMIAYYRGGWVRYSEKILNEQK